MKMQDLCDAIKQRYPEYFKAVLIDHEEKMAYLGLLKSKYCDQMTIKFDSIEVVEDKPLINRLLSSQNFIPVATTLFSEIDTAENKNGVILELLKAPVFKEKYMGRNTVLKTESELIK